MLPILVGMEPSINRNRVVSAAVWADKTQHISVICAATHALYDIAIAITAVHFLKFQAYCHTRSFLLIIR